jgi:hypothetical protein
MLIYHSVSPKRNNDWKVLGIGYGSLGRSIDPTSTRNEGTLMGVRLNLNNFKRINGLK